MDSNKYKNYLSSLGEALTDYANEAKNTAREDKPEKEKLFDEGYASAYYRVISLMKQHAETYEISEKELGLDKINESDLM